MSKSVLFFKSKSCQICKTVDTIFNEVADNFINSVEAEKVDITENMQKTIDNGVMSVPTILFYKDGREIERLSGMVSSNKLEQAFENL